jgi:N-acetylglucosamine kinase-like BadF-type ATPase
MTEAANGDSVARRCVVQQGQRMAEFALAAARQVGMEEEAFHLILTGGLFRHASTLLRDTIEHTMRERSPMEQVIVSRHEPVVGAVLLAFEALGLPVGPDVYATLEDTCPSRATFDTESPRA